MTKTAEEIAYSILDDGCFDGLPSRYFKALVAAAAVIDARYAIIKKKRELRGLEDGQQDTCRVMVYPKEEKTLLANQFKELHESAASFEAAIKDIIAFEIDSASASVGLRIKGLEEDIIRIIESRK